MSPLPHYIPVRTGRISSLSVARTHVTKDKFENSRSDQILGGVVAGNATRYLSSPSAAGSGRASRWHDCPTDGCGGGDAVISSKGAGTRWVGDGTAGRSLYLLRRQLHNDEQPHGLPDRKLLSRSRMLGRLQADQAASAQTRLALHFSIPVLVLLCPKWQAQLRATIFD